MRNAVLDCSNAPATAPTKQVQEIKVPFVDLSIQHAALRDEINQAWSGTLDRSDFILGQAVDRFERDFAAFVGVKEAVGVATGLDALRLSLAALGVGPGDEVIVPANTFIATALAVSQAGARPVLVDCDPTNYNIAVDAIEAAISPRTKAILPVHLAGLPADMDGILKCAARHHLSVVEDACQAHGASYRGQMCGGIGATGCFSFYPGKNLGALGDGGMIVTNRPELADQFRQLRNYGQRAKYEHVVAGMNSRLDTLQAAVLQIKLRRLPEWNEARGRHAIRYRELLKGVGDLQFQSGDAESRHVYHLMIVQTEHRDSLRQYLAERGIQTGIHYPCPIHLQPAYAFLGYSAGAFPVSERLAQRCFSLPMFPELADWQIEWVAQSIREWFRTAK